MKTGTAILQKFVIVFKIILSDKTFIYYDFEISQYNLVDARTFALESEKRQNRVVVNQVKLLEVFALRESN